MNGKSLSLARNARLSAISMCTRARAAHLGSSLSLIDILAVLYSGSARVDVDTVDDADRDVVIISKGHAAAAVYAVLAHAGFFPLQWLESYCSDGGQLGGHVTSGSIPGVEFSTGSLGHGLPFGVGVALAAQRRRSPARVFVVLSDGECDEGSNWEAALVASHHELGNLVVLIDRNGLQSLAATEQTVRLEPFADKWRAFGWLVSEIDGHEHRAIAKAIQEAQAGSQPTVIICRTIKGKGVSFMEDQIVWHYRPPSLEQAVIASLEIESER